MLVIALAWSLTSVCPYVQSYRDQGMTDRQIEDKARGAGVPEWVIKYAKHKCRA